MPIAIEPTTSHKEAGSETYEYEEPARHAEYVPATLKDMQQQVAAQTNHITVSKSSQNFPGMWHCRVIVRCPAWRLQMLNVEVAAKNENGQVEKVTSSKTTRPQFKLDLHPIFDELRANDRRIDRLLNRYTVNDVEDGLRLIPEDAIARFAGEVDDLVREREEIAARMDANYAGIVESVRQQFPEHFWQIEKRMPSPPFGGRLKIEMRINQISAMPSDVLISDDMPQEKRERILERVRLEGEQAVHDRIHAIIDGVMGTVADLALEINGQKPNPNFDATKPESDSNRRNLPGICSGTRRTGFIHEMCDCLERVMNFRQFMTPEILKQVQSAVTTVHGIRNITHLNTSQVIQTAIKSEFNKLGELMRGHSDDVIKGRSARQLMI